jgi:hypothetical protein
MSALRVGVLLALAVAAAVVVNLLLLGVATGDPVGKLSPRPGATILPAPPPRTVVTPPTHAGEHRNRHEDD